MNAGWIGGVAAAAALTGSLAVEAGHAPDCLRTGPVRVAGPTAYQDRGTRCEGVYDQPVSGSVNLQLVGYQTVDQEADIDRDATLAVQVLGFEEDAATTLRVLSTRRGIFYQMDTSVLGSTGAYVWPSTVLRQISRTHRDLDISDLALVACSNQCDERPTTRYWPVHVGAKPAGGSGRLTVLIKSVIELGRLDMTVRGPGQPGAPQPIRGTYFSPDRPIRVPLPEDLISGEYQLTFTATAPESRYPAGALRVALVVP